MEGDRDGVRCDRQCGDAEAALVAGGAERDEGGRHVARGDRDARLPRPGEPVDAGESDDSNAGREEDDRWQVREEVTPDGQRLDVDGPPGGVPERLGVDPERNPVARVRDPRDDLCRVGLQPVSDAREHAAGVRAERRGERVREVGLAGGPVALLEGRHAEHRGEAERAGDEAGGRREPAVCPTRPVRRRPVSVHTLGSLPAHFRLRVGTLLRAPADRSGMVSDTFDADAWTTVDGFDFDDITYHRGVDVPAVRIAFDRPDVRNAFRPGTVDELYTALDHARKQANVGCVLLTGNGPSSKDGGWAFCAGGDQSVRGDSGYEYRGDDEAASDDDPQVREAKAGRLHILEVQRLIRTMPKPVVAVVPGWAVGGGHSLHVVCDMTLASREHAKFKQTDPDVASFDGGFGSAYLAKQVGQKKAREIFFLGKTYDAEEAADMGMINEAVPHDELEATALEWADEMTGKSPTAMRMLKYAFNMTDDGMVGQQTFAGEATRLAYMTDEAQEGRDAFLEGRDPDFDDYPWHY